MAGFQMVSSDFEAGATIPRPFTCEGSDVSPALLWSGAPDGTASFALICDDPDAPGKTWTHWVIFNIPAESLGLVQRVQPHETLPDGSRQGLNDFSKIGYGGPCPPRGHGAHRYYFKLYALDTLLDLAPRARKDALIQAMDGHILGQAELMGRYAR